MRAILLQARYMIRPRPNTGLSGTIAFQILSADGSDFLPFPVRAGKMYDYIAGSRRAVPDRRF